MTAVVDELPTGQRTMKMEVPACPACRCEGTAVREKVLRGETEIDFWCCPPCGARWRERVSP
jgi:hypothetical protein